MNDQQPHPVYSSQPPQQPAFGGQQPVQPWSYPTAPPPNDHGTPFLAPGGSGGSWQAREQGLAGPPGMPAPASPRKARTALISSITGVVGLVIGLAIGSVGGADDLDAGADPNSSEQVDEVTGAEVTGAADEDVEEPEPTEAPEPVEPEPTEEPTPEPEEGSRGDPYPIGAEVGNEEWMIVLGEPYEAWAEIQAENQFNDPPEEGFEHWMVPVTATYLGDETGNAAWDLTVEFVSSDGVTYGRCREVVPNPLRDTGELYEGGVAEGNVCLTVPAGADGLWTLKAGWFGEPAFFEAGE